MSKSLDRATLWTRMRFLLESLGTRFEHESFVDECLDLLVDLLGADLGVLCVRLSSDRWRPIAARRNNQNIHLAEFDGLQAEQLEVAFKTGRSAVNEIKGGLNGGSQLKTVIFVPLRRGPRQGRGGSGRTLGGLLLEMKLGADDVNALHLEFLDSVAVLLSVTLDQRVLLETVREDLRMAQAHDRVEEGPQLHEIMAPSSMASLRADVQACVVGESSAMILGESGTGKTRLAVAIAKASGRRPLVRATLGASDDLNTITSELFGHERGSFSGAVTQRKGLVEYADGGTLILDEILNLPPHAQQLLLDFTQFGTYRPLGYQGKEPKRAHVRIISATNGNIRQAIVDTRFRQDLYFRLAGVTITLPPLRSRRSEVPDIAQRFLHDLDPARSWKLSLAATRQILSDVYEWEGNIRQLQAVIRRARDRAVAEGVSDGMLQVSHLGAPPRRERAPRPTSAAWQATPTINLNDASPCVSSSSTEDRWQELQSQRSTLDELERELIDQAMRENRGVVAHAAKQLQVSRTSLLSRMATLSVDRHQYRR
jgi:DNA-binding NtrC family response regulator